MKAIASVSLLSFLAINFFFILSIYFEAKYTIKSKNVVTMSLYGSKSRYTVGAIRNAMLVKTNFPGWTIRFYLENPNLNDSRHELVPYRVIHTLTHLESEMYYLNEEERMFSPMTWRFVSRTTFILGKLEFILT